jgi:hypothetical protein
MEKRLIRRKRLVASPGHVVLASLDNTITFKPPERGDPLYALVGEIASKWSFVETLLDNCIGALADIDGGITACITAQMQSFYPKCLTIVALANYRGLPETAKAAEKLKGKLSEAAEARNRAVHDRVLIETVENKTYKEHRMAKGELVYGLKPFEKKQLDRALVLIDERRKDCVKLSDLIRSEVYEYT